VIDHARAAINLIDEALAWLPGEPPEPASHGRCWRCGHSGRLRPSGLCKGCRSYLAMEADEDPRWDPPPEMMLHPLVRRPVAPCEAATIESYLRGEITSLVLPWSPSASSSA
jgi:hypothetical protein